MHTAFTNTFFSKQLLIVIVTVCLLFIGAQLTAQLHQEDCHEGFCIACSFSTDALSMVTDNQTETIKVVTEYVFAIAVPDLLGPKARLIRAPPSSDISSKQWDSSPKL